MYLWRTADYLPDELVGELDRESTPDRFVFLRGESAKDRLGFPTFKCPVPSHNLARFDVLPNNAMVPVVSSRLAELLRQQCPDDVEFIPTKIVCVDRDVTDYVLVNIVALIGGIDLTESRYVCITGTTKIRKVLRLVSIPGALGAHGLARDSYYGRYVWASADLRSYLEMNAIRGVDFVDPACIDEQ